MTNRALTFMRRILQWGLCSIVGLLVVGTYATGSFSLLSGGLAFAASDTPAQLSWFYRTPNNISTQRLADEYDSFVLGANDQRLRNELLNKGENINNFGVYIRMDAIQAPCNGACPCNDLPDKNNAAWKRGEYCSISANHPDWFLRDTNGNKIRIERKQYEREMVWMDPGNPGWRAFFLSRAREILRTTGYNELNLDNADASLFRFSREGIVLSKYRDQAVWQSAVSGFLAYLRNNHFRASGQRLIANITASPTHEMGAWADYLQYVDGAMNEGWVVDWSTGYLPAWHWEISMRQAELITNAGKKAILVSQGSRQAYSHQQFAFSSYLLLANQNAYFRYSDAEDYKSHWPFSNYKLKLGAPRGGRFQQGDVWRRNFQYGNVWVNPVNNTSGINVTGGSPNPNTTPSLSVRDITANEGSGVAKAVVELSSPTNRDVRFSMHTEGQSARSGQDYRGFSARQFTIRQGQSRATVDIQLIDDRAVESQERFSLRVVSATGATVQDAVGVVKINDNDTNSNMPSLSMAGVSTYERNGVARVKARLSYATSQPIKVRVHTTPGSAREGSDFWGFTRDITFAPGVTEMPIDITILKDNRNEQKESFTVRLFSAQGARIATERVTVNILP